MKLKQQVVRLELAKKLKELSCKQESLYYWQVSKLKNSKNRTFRLVNFGIMPDYPNPNVIKYEHYFSAYTASEIGEMLPQEVEEKEQSYWLNFERGLRNKWRVAYRKNGTNEH